MLDHISTPLKMSVVDIAFDSSYPTGGEAITVGNIAHGFKSIITILAEPSTNGYILSYDSTNSKLKVWQTNADYSGDTPLIEVTNATNLSLETFRCTIIGY
jgi:hypothetical protein